MWTYLSQTEVAAKIYELGNISSNTKWRCNFIKILALGQISHLTTFMLKLHCLLLSLENYKYHITPSVLLKLKNKSCLSWIISQKKVGNLFKKSWSTVAHTLQFLNKTKNLKLVDLSTTLCSIFFNSFKKLFICFPENAVSLVSVILIWSVSAADYLNIG